MQDKTVNMGLDGRAMTEAALERRSRLHWLIVASTTVLITTVLATVLTTMLDQYVRPMWPWAHTQVVLPLILAVLVCVLIAYLTQQQQIVRRLRCSLAEHVEQHQRRLVALLQVSKIMGTRTGVQPVFNAITQTCLDAYACDQVSLMILDRTSGDLVVQSVAGRTASALGERQPLGKGISGWVANRREPVVLGRTVDTSKYVEFAKRSDAPSASMVVPIVVRNDLVGVLNISSQDGRQRYEREDLRALEIFAENAGACIRHVEQVEWLRAMVERNATLADQAPASSSAAGVSD